MSSTVAHVLGAFLIAGCGNGKKQGVGSGDDAEARIVDGSVLGWDESGPYLDGGSTTCPMVACDPRNMGKCGDGGMCLLAGEEPVCIAQSGSLDEGVRCTSVSECKVGLGCFIRSFGAVCGRICCTSEESVCGDGFRCAGSGRLVDGTQTGWGLCLPRRTCDLLETPSRCDPGESCYIVSGGGETECLRAGTRGAGEACMSPNDCAPGFSCAGLNEPRCIRICSLKGDPDSPCGDKERCMAYAQSPEGTGLCTPMR